MKKDLLPGVALSGALAAASMLAATLPLMQHWGLSALSIAMLLGMLMGNTVYGRMAQSSHAGVTFSKQMLLRAGIVLFGFRLTFHDVAAVGWSGLLIDLVMLSSTFLLAMFIGRRFLGLDDQSAILIGAGSSICGAAAVLATEPVIKARAEKVTVAVATVVVFGTLAMLIWPLFFGLLQAWGWTDFRFGLFAGSTVHEVAQATVAGRSVSQLAMNTAVITKMLRVMLLAPFLLLLSFWHARRQPHGAGRTAVSMPWFAILFLVAVAVNSQLHLPAGWSHDLTYLDNVLLAMAMAALGLASPWRAVQQAGPRPLLLSAILFVWLLVGGTMVNTGVNWLMH
jgi:uncharacterized integral membrane protein (TIGR00698 family)